MVIHLIYFVVLCLNSAPSALGILQIHSPREIVIRRGLDFNKHFKHQFGTYVKAHEDPVITNTTISCTYLRVYIDTMGNIQGTPKVFDIKTGKVKSPGVLRHSMYLTMSLISWIGGGKDPKWKTRRGTFWNV